MRKRLKAPPYQIPSSCDNGPLLVIERVFIDREHRGTELGMDALVAFLRSFRWSLALADIAEIPDRNRLENSPAARAGAIFTTYTVDRFTLILAY